MVESDGLKQPWLLRQRSSTAFILAAICLTTFTDGFLYAVIVPVLPFSLKEKSGIPEDQIQQWCSYLLAVFGFATLTAAFPVGWLVDNATSRKGPFLVSLALQALSTLPFAISAQVNLLLVSRAVQGVSSAVIYSVGLALLVDTVGKERIGQKAGFVVSSAFLGVIISPLLGGFIYAKLGYSAVVMLMILLPIAGLFLGLVLVEKRVAKSWLHTAPIHNDEESAEYQHAACGTEQPNGLANGFADHCPSSHGDEEEPLLHKPAETTAPRKNIPAFLLLLTSPRALTSFYAALVGYTLLGAFDAALPLFVKEQFHWNSSAAGAMFLAIAFPSLLGPVAGHYSDVLGPKWIIVGGFAVSSVSVIFLRFIVEPTAFQILLLIVLLLLIGAGMAFVFSPVTNDLTDIATRMADEHPDLVVSTGAYGQAYALFNCGIAGGTMLGPLIMRFAIPLYGWNAATLMLGAVGLTAVLPVIVFSL